MNGVGKPETNGARGVTQSGKAERSPEEIGQQKAKELWKHKLSAGFVEREGQRLYYMEWGKKGGVPFIFFHGGPGDSFYDSHMRLFNPDTDHVLFFDQRGSGASQPSANGLTEKQIVATNTPDQMIGDTEFLRSKIFGSKKVNLVGGSWGSTLALLYAEAHSEQVASMTMWATYLAEHGETDEMFSDRSGDKDFPYQAAWKEFLDLVPMNRRGKNGKIDPRMIAEFYAEMIGSSNRATALKHARAFYKWELTLCAPEDFETVWKHLTEDEDQLIAGARIEITYHKHHTMIADGRIRADVGKIKGIRTRIVQGKKDLCTPTKHAKKLEKVYGKNCTIDEVDGGHIRDDIEVNKAIRKNLDEVRAGHVPEEGK
jgi:proline iminopeptidase